MKIFRIVALAVVLVIGGAALYGKLKTDAPKNSFRTATATRGDLLITVTATGIVEPEEVVDIGAQVVGRIKELGTDPRGRSDSAFQNKRLDYGSPVEEGMLLAQIDPSIYSAQFKQAEASLAQAKANVLQMEAKCMQADAEWKRAQRLRALKLTSMSPTGSKAGQALPIKGISDADFILAQANYDSAVANVVAAKATVDQQDATLLLAKTNLEYTTIKSPVNGTIIDRRVSIGQTVVSAMSAPSLFLIAKDLRRMQVWASVNEADIGRLKVATPVHFSVDAFPKDIFRGEVTQIRLNASMTQNVVTYTVVITADNSDLKLLPYLTADVKFEVDERKGALLVPNAALRFQPRPDQIAKTESAGDPASAGGSETLADETWGNVWVRQDDADLVYPIKVQFGLTDGTFTEIVGGDLDEHAEIVVGEKRAEAGGEVNNPFVPLRFRGTKKQKDDVKDKPAETQKSS
jgi:HlyD family secretion protein